MKKSRHDKIMELIQEYDIETQEELAGKLKEEGFCVTQATVSRDIRRLGLSKVPKEDGGQKYAVLVREGGPPEGAPPEGRYVHMMQEAFSSAEAAGNLLVLRTASGMAMAVASALDTLEFPEIVGCVAGDDTIFAATHTKEEAVQLLGKIHKMIGT